MENTLTFLAEISEADWANTPESVKQLVKRLVERIEALEAGQQELQEQIQRNSQNSSQPPSQDKPKGFQPKQKKQSGKARGGQPGHEGHSQELYPLEECAGSEDHYPETCIECGHQLQGEDPDPYRCQTIELPPLQPVVYEHRFHALECPCCGVRTRAYVEEIIDGSRYGERLCSLVALLSGEYRQSHQMVVRLLNELFEIPISVGSVGRLRQEISEAVAAAVEGAHAYVQQQPVVGVDETSLPQGNGDGNNVKGKRGWLWVVVTPLVCYFQVSLSRSKAVAQDLLGVNFAGMVNSDRYSAYQWLALQLRQLCWAHLKRDFTKISERSGESGSLGQGLLKQHEKLFELWHRVRDGTLSRAQFILEVAPIRQAVEALLKEGAEYPIGKKDKTPLAKTVRTCQQLLKVEPALWLFVTVEGVEPTNNAAERAIRPAVLWRRTSYGSQSEAGSLFVGRMMTVVTTLRCQKRNVLDYLAEACRAKRQGLPAPSLLPPVQPPLPAIDAP
jgi:transposase